MENLLDIVKNTTAKLTHICNCKAYYQIDTDKHSYQLEINCSDSEWQNTYIQPEYKTITLMRWIRKAIDNNDESFIELR